MSGGDPSGGGAGGGVGGGAGGRTAPTTEPDGPQVLCDAAVAFVLFMMLPVAAMSLFTETTDLPTRVENGSMILLCGIVPLLGYAWFRGAELPARLVAGRSLGSYLAFLVVWIPLAMFLYPYLVHIAGFEFHAQESVLYYVDDGAKPYLWIVVLVTCVGAPIAEEIFFRGFLYRAVAYASSPFVAVIVTALLFGAVHEAAVAIPVGALGLCFGYLRMKTGGIGSSILIHMVHNTWNVALLIASPEIVELIYDK